MERETDSYGVCGVARARRCGVGGDIGELGEIEINAKKKIPPRAPVAGTPQSPLAGYAYFKVCGLNGEPMPHTPHSLHLPSKGL